MMSARHRRFALLRTLAVMLAVFSSVAAMGQSKKGETDWMKDFTSRITLNGYAQGGWSYQNPNGKPTNAYNLKRTLLWAKARITDRWSFMFMHDFSSVVQEFYTDYRISKGNELTVRLGQFKHSYSMEKNYGRDMGLEVFGDLAKGVVHYELALMSGQGINRRDLNNQKDFIAKLELRPMPGFRVVASGYLGTGCAVNTAAWNPDIQVGDNYKRNRYSIGAEYKTEPYAGSKYKEARPASIRAEWLGGQDGDVGSRGGYATVSIPVVDALEHEGGWLGSDQPDTGTAILVLQEVPCAVAVHPLPLRREYQLEGLRLAAGTGAGGILIEN